MYKILTNSTDQSELKYLKTLINISQHIVITKTVEYCIVNVERSLLFGACLIYVICVCLCIVVSHIYCVMFLFCFLSSCVPYVASFSGLSFLNCPFSIL